MEQQKAADERLRAAEKQREEMRRHAYEERKDAILSEIEEEEQRYKARFQRLERKWADHAAERADQERKKVLATFKSSLQPILSPGPSRSTQYLRAAQSITLEIREVPGFEKGSVRIICGPNWPSIVP